MKRGGSAPLSLFIPLDLHTRYVIFPAIFDSFDDAVVDEPVHPIPGARRVSAKQRDSSLTHLDKDRLFTVHHSNHLSAHLEQTAAVLALARHCHHAMAGTC